MVNTTDLVIEFVEACVHQILYSKGVYIAGVFEKRLKYGTQVFQSRHPDINSYIRKVLGNAYPLMDAGLVDGVVVALSRKEHGAEPSPIENIGISCAIVNRISGKEHGGVEAMELDTDAASAAATISEETLFNLEKDMRSALVELMKMPKVVGEECTWAIQVHTSKGGVGVDAHQDAVLRESLKSMQWKVDESETLAPFSNSGDDHNRSLQGIGSFSNSIFNCNITRTTFTS